MTLEQVITFLKAVDPGLTPVQEWVLIQSWNAKTYSEMAAERHYRVEYIRRVGAELWSVLSAALQIPITKPYLRDLLEGYDLSLVQQQMSESQPPPQSAQMGGFPSAPLSADSPFYVPRPPIEALALACIQEPGSLLRIKAPTKMGKSSLILRILAAAKSLDYQTVSLDLQQADQAVLANSNRFLRWFSANLSLRLDLPPQLDQFWDDEIGSKVSCTYYVEKAILAPLQCPLVLALDEVNCIFAHPEIATEFLPLLRAWHARARQIPQWQNLRLVLAYATEVYVPLNLNQSPFNVGLPLELPCLSEAQVQSLVLQYGLDLKSDAKLKQFVSLVGGFPYLVQLGLYYLQSGMATLDQLLAEAATESGIYRQHFRQLLGLLQSEPPLLDAFKQVIAADGLKLEAITAYRLTSLGLIQLSGNLAAPSCELYRAYFRSQFLP
ncbi:MAG: AAA-like domain-containing protein [Pegethrix bostrychoides GSE-TBD4-15B]|jgi:hypothetical protein|uniref:AAA-like domain-containing protein n=1 Tax=Pegethrix bostrychoides GSE-TBD4-15B TaxID=2839662 RepID=A0A951PDW3_9CYAN|nr:AAA-like domain-containing protein [Pegethrix bostrychoides GSE-TBD4-15B]